MIVGLYLRNMGPASEPSVLGRCARAADRLGVRELWVADHIAIPPDDAEGSGGRYVDPLATLAYLAGHTERVRLGTAALVLPYRPPLVTAKLVASIQELSGNRMLLGIGAGWMKAEFNALGLDRSARGGATDETLRFLHSCFAGDEVEANGQRFLFLPRPPRPPIFVGGSPPHAFRRAVAFGEGWMPVGLGAAALGEAAKPLYELAEKEGKPRPEIVMIASLDLDTPSKAEAQAREFAAAGVTRFIHAQRYASVEEFTALAEACAELDRTLAA